MRLQITIMILDTAFIEEYNKIYSQNTTSIANAYFYHSELLGKNKEYFQKIDNVELSDYFFNLNLNAQNEITEVNAKSSALFTLHILLSCLDVDFRFRVISKRKLIILLNMRNSTLVDQSELFKKLLMTHGVSDEFIEESRLIRKDALIYCCDQEEIDLNQLNMQCLLESTSQYSASLDNHTVEKIHHFTDQFLQSFIQIKAQKQDINIDDSDEVLLSKIFKNQIDMQDLIYNFPKRTSALLTFALQHYRFATWQSKHSGYVSLYYDTQQGHPLASILENDTVQIRFDCEYFIESLVLKLDTITQAEHIISGLEHEQECIQFKVILVKSGLAKNEIKQHFKVDVFGSIRK